MKRRTVAVIVVSAVVVMIGLAIGAWFAGRAFFQHVKPKPVTEADRKLVVTAARLHEFGGPEPIPDYERMTVQRIFGTANVEYEYDIPLSAEVEDKVYIQSTLMVATTKAEAMQQHTFATLGLKGGMLAAREVKVEPAPRLLNFGDQKYAATMSMNGRTVGNMFVVRDGRVVHMLILSGIYFEDPAEVEKLMKPAVDEARKQFMRKR